MKDYWSQKAGRRRVVAGLALGGAGVAALSVIGCGGGGSGRPKEEASSLVSKPVDSTTRVVRGGLYQAFVITEAANFDAIAANNASVSVQAGFTYPFLVRNKMVKYPAAYDGDVEAEAAESWEVSADGLQYTFKVRPAKLDPRAPSNGRTLDAQDVKWSWDYFAGKSSSRTILSYDADKTAPIQSVTVPDSRTVVMKLAFPYAPFLPMLAYYRHLPIMPREAEGGAGGFDIRGDMRGSGAWRLDKYTRSVSYAYRRNPDYFDADRLYLDGIDVFIIPEYATGIAQFRAGNLWSFDVRAEDIIATKREVPPLVLLGDEAFAKSTTPWIGFSNQPNSPFRDERVRRAVSMLIDRDLWIDTFFNVSNFARDGLNAETRWHTHVSSGEDGYWTDPKGKDLGDGAANFAYNPAEAKKLLAAAGYTRAIESVFSYTPNGYASTYVKQAEAAKGMLETNGDFKFTFNTPDYSTEWLAPGKYHYGNGSYEGIVQGSSNTYPEIDGHLQAYFHSASIRVWHGNKDPQIDALVERQRKELNRERRVEAIKEFQRYTAKTVPSLIAPGLARGYSLAWPWIGNRGLWRTSGSRAQTYTHLWFDQSKKAG